jgi:hypothetical protein
MHEVYIAPAKEGKGRTFRAICLATVEADSLWEGGQTATDDVRPVWAMFTNSEQELRPFMVNLTRGRKAASFSGERWGRRKATCLEVLRSSHVITSWQREPEGAIATVIMPDLFQLDPGMVDTKGAAFVLLPPVEWGAAQHIDVKPLVRHTKRLLPKRVRTGDDALTDDALAALVPEAFLFATYLDRRTRCPLVSDGRFYLQLLIACLDAGIASWPNAESYHYRDHPFGFNPKLGFHTQGTEDVGLTKGIAFLADHPTIERVLAEQVTTFFQNARA